MATDNHSNVYVNADGEEVVRVSHVIRTLGREQLVMWAHMLGWKRINYKDELNRTANIGTFAHAMIELYYSDHELCYYDFESYKIWRWSDQQEAYNAAQSFFKWLDKNERLYKVIATEQTIIGKNAGGTIDCIIQSPIHENKIILVDYKTSSSIHFTQFLQLAGYVILYEETQREFEVEGVMVVRLDKKYGHTAEAKFIFRRDLEPYIECFKSLLSVALLSSTLEKEFRYDTQDFADAFN